MRDSRVVLPGCMLHADPAAEAPFRQIATPGFVVHVRFQWRVFDLKGLLNLMGMSAGGWLGWILGAQVSFFTGYVVSMVGTGVGLFLTQRAIKRLLP